MTTPRSISRNPLEAHSLQYAYLLAKGLAAAQRYSGGIWTDYNHHDPGVTLLEQLCYALTDLAYRTHLDISDILFHQGNKALVAQQNLFLQPHDIYPNDPVTELDFRRLIIDRVKKVKNAWVIPVGDHPAGYKGLIRILVQCAMDLDDSSRNSIQEEVAELFHEHRQLCQDLDSVVLLKEEVLEFSGKIHLAPDAIGEQVMARIFHAVEHYINPDVNFDNPFELIRQGRSPQEVFEGPKPIYGYISPHDLKPKVTTLYVSRIRDILLKIPGIQDIEDFTIYQSGVKVLGNIIKIAEDAFPVLFNDFDAWQQRCYQLEFFKEKIRYDIDGQSLKQLYDALISADLSSYLRKIHYRGVNYGGRFSEAEFKAYYSIQHELPDNYGLGLNGLPPGADLKRLAQRKQLKAYLLFFEQIMADYLAQLALSAKVFSIDDALEHTYFTQAPEDIPDLVAVLRNPVSQYGENIKLLSEDPKTFFERRSRVLDHLLARFGERFSADILRKFLIETTPAEWEEVEKYLLRARIRLLKEYADLSRQRGTAFNYRKPYWNNNSWFGLARKLGNLLHIKTLEPRQLAQPILHNAHVTALVDNSEWNPLEITVEGGATLSVMAKPLDTYEPNRFQYYTQTSNFLDDIFRFGTSEANYRIVKDESLGIFWVIYTGRIQTLPTLVFGGVTRQECRDAIEKAIQKWKSLNQATEGVHIVEHILLRPLTQRSYSFVLLDAEGKLPILKALQKGSFASQRDVAEDVRLLGARRDAFQIQMNPEGTFEVILFDSGNRPVATIPEMFPTTASAESSLAMAFRYVSQLTKNPQAFDKAVDISLEKADFPEYLPDFSFSNTCSLVFPAWPSRFQNMEFRKIVGQLVDENLPAHVRAQLLFLPFKKMLEFENLLEQWLKEKSKPTPDWPELDKRSLKLVRFLQDAKTRYSW